MTDKSDDRVGHLNTTLARGGGNLNDPIFKSSNARGGGGGGLPINNSVATFDSNHPFTVLLLLAR